MSIKNAYNKWATIYDTNKNRTRDLDKLVTKEILGKIHFSNVIELGSGTGKNTEFLLTKAKSVLGLDFSQEMIHKANQKIDDKRVVFRKADLNSEWNIDHQADLVTCSLTLEHIRNLDAIFSKANRQLIPNGHFYICELHPFKQYLGSKARFEDNGEIEVLETYTHHVSAYLVAAQANGFILIDLNEWFDDENKLEIPRLVSFLFRKK